MANQTSISVPLFSNRKAHGLYAVLIAMTCLGALPDVSQAQTPPPGVAALPASSSQTAQRDRPDAAASATKAYRAARAAHRAGQLTTAQALIDQALAAHPDDVRLRFLKGVVLHEQGQIEAALDVFLNLTRTDPERPEPYNNLAVLQAAQGQLEAARDTLEAAVRAAPHYAMAHENLGDLYLNLAQQAYQRALESDASRALVTRKMQCIQTMPSMTGAQPVSRRDAHLKETSE